MLRFTGFLRSGMEIQNHNLERTWSVVILTGKWRLSSLVLSSILVQEKISLQDDCFLVRYAVVWKYTSITLSKNNASKTSISITVLNQKSWNLFQLETYWQFLEY